MHECFGVNPSGSLTLDRSVIRRTKANEKEKEKTAGCADVDFMLTVCDTISLRREGYVTAAALKSSAKRRQ